MDTLSNNLDALKARIETACQQCGRDPKDITLVGVSKTKPASAVRAAAELGVRDIGENYLDEAIHKIAACQALGLRWHYIGRIQSNKTKTIAEAFDWVHTVDRLKIAQRLNRQCPQDKQLNVLIQVNIDADPAKGGMLQDDVTQLLEQLSQFPQLRPRGLMTILAERSNPRASYQSVAQLAAELRTQLPAAQQADWDSLSMGMTADMEDAIAAGATHLRIGTALFGARET